MTKLWIIWARHVHPFRLFIRPAPNLSKLCNNLRSKHWQSLYHPRHRSRSTLWLTLWFSGVCWSVSCGEVRKYLSERNLQASGSTFSTGQAQARATCCSENRLRPAIRLNLYWQGWSSQLSHIFCDHLKTLCRVEGRPELIEWFV